MKIFFLSVLVLCLLPTAIVLAKPTTPEQAQKVVLNWLSLDNRPLGSGLGDSIKEVKSFYDSSGKLSYCIVYLNPAGFVIVPGDDLVEPIIGFLPEGTYDPSPENPLGALVSRDVPGRVIKAREIEAMEGLAFSPTGLMKDAQQKWNTLLNQTKEAFKREFGLVNISDIRVAPLIQSKWSQTTCGGQTCYNYYTPNNYPSGCVATAMSQLMRYYSYPQAGVGTASFTIWVDNIAQSRSLRGGDGSGGPYDWANMVLDPSSTSPSTTQRQAIGSLTHDAGVSVGMSYTSSSSGADTRQAAIALVNTFGYSNAIRGYNSGSNLPLTNLYNMVNPNLDSRYPVLFGITGSSGGHAIVGDGYGYNVATIYHHLNMGWSGANDAWYNLPTIDDSYYGFNSVYKCVYNVYTSMSGEIISGRVLNSNGNPIQGALVTGTGSGFSAGCSTDSNGIYALRIPSNSQCTISVSKTGYTVTDQTVSTGTSTDNTISTGNSWGVNFVASSAEGKRSMPWLMLLLGD